MRARPAADSTRTCNTGLTRSVKCFQQSVSRRGHFHTIRLAAARLPVNSNDADTLAPIPRARLYAPRNEPRAARIELYRLALI